MGRGVGPAFGLVMRRNGVCQPLVLGAGGSRAVALPLGAALIAGNLLECAAAQRRTVKLVDVEAGLNELVPMLDQQPLGALASGAPRTHFGEHEFAIQFLAMQPELEITLGKHLSGERVLLGRGLRWLRHVRGCGGNNQLPGSDIPDHHRSRAIVARRNNPLEIEVRNRMVFHLHRQPLVGRIE